MGTLPGCMSVYYVHTRSCGNQKRVVDPLELELQMALRIQHKTSRKAATALLDVYQKQLFETSGNCIFNILGGTVF